MSDDREKQNKKTLQTSKNGLQRCFLASLGRFELPAFRLGGERSILLSYRDVYQIYSIFPLKRIRTSCRLGGGRSILLSYGDRCMGLPHGMRGWGAAKGAAGADGLTKSRPALPKG